MALKSPLDVWLPIDNRICSKTLSIWEDRVSSVRECLDLCKSTAICSSVSTATQESGITCRASSFYGMSELGLLTRSMNWTTYVRALEHSAAGIEDKCNAVNNLERIAQKNATDEVMSSYDYALHALANITIVGSRGAHFCERSGFLKCRLHVLSPDLCKLGQSLALPKQLENNSQSNLTGWARFADEVTANLQQHCNTFHRYAEFSDRSIHPDDHWDPPLFAWFHRDLAFDMLAQLMKHQNWPLMSAALEKGGLYAGRAAPAVGIRNGLPIQGFRTFSVELINKAYDLNVMQEAGIPLSRFQQVFEFGGGTGNLAFLLPLLGFIGTHVVHDIPPMRLLQYHFLRLHGQPVYLGETIPRHPFNRSAVILEIGHSPNWNHFVNDLHTLFFGTFSLGETPHRVRHQMLRQSRHVAGWFLTFHEFHIADGLDNLKFFMHHIEHGVLRHHSVCLWNMCSKYRKGNRPYYLVALRRDLGKVQCPEWAGCKPSAVVHCEGYTSLQPYWILRHKTDPGC